MRFDLLIRLQASVCALFIAASLHAAIPSVPPEILAQLQSMSPAEQRAIAAQYGFSLDEISGTATGYPVNDPKLRPKLGSPGEPLEPAILSELEEPVRDEDDREDAELERFGARLFDSYVSTFEPVDNIPVPEGYRLGVGDELRVLLIGKERGDYPLRVDREGAVTLPKLGRVVLGGLTFPEAKELIETRVSEQLIGSEALLSMGPLGSINVFIAGEVRAPGNYSVSALSTLSQAIFIAGGISNSGTYRTVELKRQGETVETFDVYDLLLYGDNSSDVRLQSGDVVFVPLSGPQVQLHGEVVRPAIYETAVGDTIKTVLDMAGGLKARGYSKQVLLNRYEAGQALPSISTISLQDPNSLAMEALDGDSLHIRAVTERVSNPIEIVGETELNEMIGWSSGVRISDVFGDIEGSLKPSADLSISLVVRRVNSLNDIAVLPVSIRNAVFDPSSKDNIQLKPFDRIVVLPVPSPDTVVYDDDDEEEQQKTGSIDGTEMLDARDEDEDEEESVTRKELMEPIVEKLKQQSRSGERAQVVEIAGAVREPGEYPLIGEGSISSTIALAGGFLDSSYLRKVEVRRIVLSDTQEASTEMLNVDLTRDSGLAFQLKGRDTLRISTIPNWSTNETVELKGEFLFPGSYTISQGETIGDLIRRAGGFTEDAFLQGAQFYSATARELQTRQLEKISASIERRVASQRATSEMGSTIEQSDLFESFDDELMGRVVVDLEALVSGDGNADVNVGNGDELFVPKFTNTIAVVGEVYEPGTFKLINGRSIDDYIETAGGETIYALSRNTYLLKANGTVRFSREGLFSNLTKFNENSVGVVEAGDVIVVPTNLDYERPLTRVTAVTNVVFQSLTSIAAFLSITKQ